MAEELEFENCDTATVFAEVRRKTETQEARSLWNRLLPHRPGSIDSRTVSRRQK